MDKHFLPVGNVILRRLRVDGKLNIDATPREGSSEVPKGSLDLRFAQVSTLNHNWRVWPKEKDDQNEKNDELFLNGLTYRALGEKFQDGTEDLEERLDAEEKPKDPGDGRPPADESILLPDIRWLRLQPKNPFRLQPYEQLAKVLRASGDESGAKQVLIAKQDDLRRYGKVEKWEKFWNSFLGLMIRHGYEPQRAFWGMLGFVAGGVLIFWLAGRSSLIIHAVDGEKLKPYPSFSPFIYSLDKFLPIVDLRQKGYWLPNAHKTWDSWCKSTLLYTSFVVGS